MTAPGRRAARSLGAAREFGIGLVGAAVLVAAVFWPVLAGRQTFFAALPGGLGLPPAPTARFLIDPQDSVWQSYPWARLVHEAAAAGRAPVWTPRTGAGEPLVPSTIGAATSPLRWWTYVIEPTVRRWDLYLLARLVLTGALAWGWARAAGLATAGAAVATAGWTLSGFVVRQLNLATLEAELVLPGLGWAAVAFARTGSRAAWAALAAAGGAVMLAGNPQPAIVCGGFAAAVVAMIAPRRIPAMVAAGVVALLLAAPFLFPLADFFPRAHHVHALQGTSSEPWRGLVGLVAPWWFGPFGGRRGWDLPAVHLLPWAGLTVVLLALLGLRRAWSSPSGRVLVLAPVVLLALAFGVPPVAWLARLPVLDLIWWSKYLGPAFLALATLAGLGAERLLTRLPRRAALLPMAVVAIDLAWCVPRDRPAPWDPIVPGPAVRELIARMDPLNDRVWAFGRPLMPQPLAAAGLADVRTYYGLTPRRSYWYVRALVTGPAPTSNDAVFTGTSRPPARDGARALSPLAAGWLVSAGPLPETWRREARPVRVAGGLHIYRAPALPRARVAGRAIRVDGPERALWELSGAPDDPGAVVVEGPADWIGFTIRSAVAAARVTRDDGDRLEVAVPGSGPRVLVVADAFEPGWRALADGRRLRVLPANVMFRAVAVPPGATRVSFIYVPIPFALGLWLGLMAAAALAAFALPGTRNARVR